MIALTDNRPRLRKKQPKATINPLIVLNGYTHDAPGVNVPGLDFQRLAEGLAGLGGNVHGHLDRLYADALASTGDFQLPMTIGGDTRRSSIVIGGHLWGNDKEARRGPERADVMIVGKIMTEKDVQKKRHFSGVAEKLLISTLENYDADNLPCWYVTNLIKCLSPLSNLPALRSVWVQDFLPLLQLELRIVRPKYLLLLGADALKAVLGRDKTLRQMEGQVVSYSFRIDSGDSNQEVWHKTLVMACIHPGYVIANPKVEPQFNFNIDRFSKLTLGVRWDKAEAGIDHREIDSLEALRALIFEIENEPEAYGPPSAAGKRQLVLGLDSEWHGEHPQNAGSYARMVQVSWKDKTAAVIHLTYPGGKPRFKEGIPKAIKALLRLLKSNKKRDVRLVGNFLVSDLEWFLALGIDLRAEFDAPASWQATRTQGGFDIGYAAHAIEETSPLDLTSLMLRYTTAPRYDVKLDKWKTAYCKEHGLKASDLGGYGNCPDEILVPYANFDADVTRRIYWKLQELLDSDRFGNCCRKAFWTTQRTMLAILEMNTTGFLVDRGRIDALTEAYIKALKNIDAIIAAWANWPDLNLNSHFHVRELLYGEALNGKKPRPGEKVYRHRPTGVYDHEKGEWITLPGVSLKLAPVLATGKRPVEWDDAVSRHIEGEPYPVPATNRQALAILAQKAMSFQKVGISGDILECDYSQPVLWLRDRRFLAQVLRSLLRVPVSGKNGKYVEEDGFYTYDKGLPGSICDDGRVRAYFMPTKETGRWSSVRPPTMNFAKRREEDYVRLLGKEYLYPLRTIVKASPGYALVEADYVGAELLGAAIMSGDKQLLEDCRRNALPRNDPEFFDIHSSVAVLAFKFKCPPTQAGLESIGKLYMRIVAKAVIFGTLYGRGAKAIAIQAREEGAWISDDEAQNVINAIAKRYPGLKAFFDECRERALDPGWICGAWGRYRRSFDVHDVESQGDLEREFMNFPIQGLIADTMNRAVDFLYRYRSEPNAVSRNYEFLMQIHDALVFEVPLTEVEPFVDVVLPECMCNRTPIVPCKLDGQPLDRGPYTLAIDVSVQRHWGEKLTKEDCRQLRIPERFAGSH